MKRNSKFSRRKFVGGMLRGALVAAVAPNFIPLRVLAGDNTPSKKIQLGHIGVGGQGTNDLRNFLTVDSAASVAICDPFRQRRENAAKFVRDAQKLEPKLYNDFHDLLDPAAAVCHCPPLPVHAAFVYDLEGDITDVPTTLRRSKEDCPKVG